jgi:CRP-like cAMP-binding protein
MALDAITDRLLGLDIFRGLAAPQIERLAREAERLIFRDGQKIVEAGAESDGALVIIGGRAHALADPAHGLDEFTIEAGSMLGEIAMLAEHKSAVTVVAEGDVRAVKVIREILRRHMEEDAELAGHFHERLAARLQRTALELKMIDERLAVAALAVAAPNEATA